MGAAIDLGVLTAAFALSFDLRASLVAAIFRRPLSLAAVIIVGAVLVLVGRGIVRVFWALVGHTPGIRFLAIRLSRADGSREVSFGCAVRRACRDPQPPPARSWVLLILRDPNRRTWADRITGTVVIYDVAARTAPHAAVDSTPALAARRRAKTYRSCRASVVAVCRQHHGALGLVLHSVARGRP